MLTLGIAFTTSERLLLDVGGRECGDALGHRLDVDFTPCRRDDYFFQTAGLGALRQHGSCRIEGRDDGSSERSLL
jgi:hypothetical protein